MTSNELRRDSNGRSSGEHFHDRDVHFDRSPEEIKQDANAFFSRKQMGNHDLQSLKRSFDDFNRLTDFDRAVESHDLFRAYA